MSTLVDLDGARLEGELARLTASLPAGAFATLRIRRASAETLSVRRGVTTPPRLREDAGAMWTVYHDGGSGYAATARLDHEGLRKAMEQALGWARCSASLGLEPVPPPGLPRAAIAAPPPEGSTLPERIDLVQTAAAGLAGDPRIVDWSAGLTRTREESALLSSDGGRIEQSFGFLAPALRASAHAPGETQTRSFGGEGWVRQGDIDSLIASGFLAAPPRLVAEALTLLDAPDCPAGTLDLVLAPDQVILQVHESIGHPIELDRILGDERNYAGTSFVTAGMFGHYRYGSPLLNVTFDPGVPGEAASYAFDDEGTAAERVHLIRDGLLLRPLGGAGSQARASLAGTANARACSWNRPPIDRMANLNLEPGDSTLAELVAGVERGVYMETNCAWSIDDRRDKFQFGCEWGRLIENGELTEVVKNPGYRGRSADFWRGLDGVGDRSTFEVLGTSYCGKGEPNQAIRVGHAVPACRFRRVAVFGGGAGA